MPDSEQPRAASPDKTACIYCGSPMPSTASICATCKSYQSRWRNTVTYLAGIAGFITLVASGVTFIYSQASSLIKADRITLAYLKYPGDTVIINAGDGDVFASSFEFYWRAIGATWQIPVNTFIPKGTLQNVSLPYIDNRTPGSQRIPIETTESYSWISNKSGVPYKELFYKSQPFGGGKCVLAYFLSKDHFEIARSNAFFNRQGEKLATAPTEAYLNWVSVYSSKPMRTQLADVVAAFKFQPGEDCERAQWDHRD